MMSGATLRTLRRRSGRTQAQISAVTGIPVSVLSAYERGRRQPGLDTAARVIAALGFRVEFVPAVEPAVRARRLEEVLALADALPFRPRPLAKARR